MQSKHNSQRHAELVSATTLLAKSEPYNVGLLLSASQNRYLCDPEINSG
jgi:hypothetical protein